MIPTKLCFLGKGNANIFCPPEFHFHTKFHKTGKSSKFVVQKTSEAQIDIQKTV